MQRKLFRILWSSSSLYERRGEEGTQPNSYVFVCWFYRMFAVCCGGAATAVLRDSAVSLNSNNYVTAWPRFKLKYIYNTIFLTDVIYDSDFRLIASVCVPLQVVYWSENEKRLLTWHQAADELGYFEDAEEKLLLKKN